MKAISRSACFLTAMTLIVAGSARAGEIPIDISRLVNEPWTFSGPDGAGIINGNTFPSGLLYFGGVPFAIPSAPNNYWSCAAAANFGAGTVSLTIPVGVAGATSAYTILNTIWGLPGPTPYLYVTFKWDNGATYTRPLIGNVNVRDYNNDGNTNTINNTSSIQVWDNGLGQRLDRQEYILPARFNSNVLTSVTLTDTGNQGEGHSRAALAALTISTCSADVTEGLTVSGGAIVYHPKANLYTQDVSLTNSGTTTLAGPIYLILENLPAGISLVNDSHLTTCYAPIGSLYVTALPEGASLAPNTTEILELFLSDPAGTAISYTPLAVSSLGGTP